VKTRSTGKIVTPSILSRLVQQDTKEDAIAVIVNAGLDPDAGEVAYRTWCRLNQTSVLQSDVTRVRAARRIDLQRGLLEDSS
jgi:hypothetical protein